VSLLEFEELGFLVCLEAIAISVMVYSCGLEPPRNSSELLCRLYILCIVVSVRELRNLELFFR
jgi:hypothetical protein